MEPSKNIVRGMLAFEELLHEHPEWRGEVVHVALAYPSRQGLAEYLAYAADVEHTAERINHALGGRLGLDPDPALGRRRLGPVPRGTERVATCSWSTRCATASTSWPRRARSLNTAQGALVLSRQAGAWEELALGGRGAIGINPFDVSGTAEALHAALSMPAASEPPRAAALRAAVQARTRGRLVGRPARPRPVTLEPARPAPHARGGRRRRPASSQQRDGAGCTAHRQVGLRRDLGRALAVDRRDADHVEPIAARRGQLAERGEGGQVADVVTERSQVPQRLRRG